MISGSCCNLGSITCNVKPLCLPFRLRVQGRSISRSVFFSDRQKGPKINRQTRRLNSDQSGFQISTVPRSSLSLTNSQYSVINFQTAYKITSQLRDLADHWDRKKPTLYHLPYVMLFKIFLNICKPDLLPPFKIPDQSGCQVPTVQCTQSLMYNLIVPATKCLTTNSGQTYKKVS